MRVYIPTKQKQTTVCVCLAMICGAILFTLSYFAMSGKGLVQLAAFALWAFGLWIACRYSLVYYYYAVDGKNFRIVKVSGEKHQDVCNISMSTGIFLKKVSEAKDRKPVRNRFNYCRNFAPKEAYVYYFEWNGAMAEIIFEPSKDFADIMNEAMIVAQSEAKAEATNGWYEE